jgi:ABC-2 type transport system permease protein
MNTTPNSQFELVQETGWKRGLGNLMRGEFSAWFNSSKWWKHLIMWFVIINVMMAIMVYASDQAEQAGGTGPPILFMYGIFGGMFVAFGVMIIMQRVIVGEKKAGTAAWVLSKPVTRTAFVISRLVGNSIAILLTSVFVPAWIFYATLGSLSDIGWLSPAGFLASIGMMLMHTFFWITLVLMMGTLFESSGGVIAVPMVLYFILWMGGGMIPGLEYVSPLLLTFSPDPNLMNSISFSLMTGTPVFSWMPLISTVVLSIVFIAIAAHRFNQQEF